MPAIVLMELWGLLDVVYWPSTAKKSEACLPKSLYQWMTILLDAGTLLGGTIKNNALHEHI
jgi:hypothetical protein